MSNKEQRFTLGLLAMEGSVLSSLIGPTDMFRIAQKLAQVRDPGTPLRLETVLIGARGLTHVSGSGGLQLSGVQSPDLALDCLLIPGIMHDSADDLIKRLAGYQPEMELLRAMHLRGVPLIAACCGGFLLAETDLLDGHDATTSWWLDAAFRKRYPNVQLDVERMMLIDTERQSQAPYITLALTERPRHSLSEKAERFIQQQLHRDLSVSELAEYCDTSERSLLRHFRQHYNASPIAHIQHLRVERAKAFLETTLMSFDEIVERCGYHDSASFRKLFKRATHLTPADYRERFRLRA